MCRDERTFRNEGQAHVLYRDFTSQPFGVLAGLQHAGLRASRRGPAWLHLLSRKVRLGLIPIGLAVQRRRGRLSLLGEWPGEGLRSSVSEVPTSVYRVAV